MAKSCQWCGEKLHGPKVKIHYGCDGDPYCSAFCREQGDRVVEEYKKHPELLEDKQ